MHIVPMINDDKMMFYFYSICSSVSTYQSVHDVIKTAAAADVSLTSQTTRCQTSPASAMTPL